MNLKWLVSKFNPTCLSEKVHKECDPKLYAYQWQIFRYGLCKASIEYHMHGSDVKQVVPEARKRKLYELRIIPTPKLCGFE